MTDYSDDEGIRGEERVSAQASATINIFNWRLALKEKVATFIE